MVGKLLLCLAQVVGGVRRLLCGIDTTDLFNGIVESGILLGSELEVLQRTDRVLLGGHIAHAFHKIGARVVRRQPQGLVDIADSEVEVLLKQVQFGKLHQGTSIQRIDFHRLVERRRNVVLVTQGIIHIGQQEIGVKVIGVELQRLVDVNHGLSYLFSGKKGFGATDI